MLTRTVARLLLAPILLIAVAVLVKGYGQTGDGFSAGVIAALGVLLQYLALGAEEAERLLPVHRFPALAVGGLLSALALAFAPLAWGEPPLTHLPAPGADVIKLGSLELITAVAFDLAIFALVLGAVVGILHSLAHPVEEGPR